MVWFDGSPVVKGTVSLYDGGRYIQMMSVDKNGKFAFDVYGDFNYVIVAEVLGERRGKSNRISIGDKSTKLKLVLDSTIDIRIVPAHGRGRAPVLRSVTIRSLE